MNFFADQLESNGNVDTFNCEMNITMDYNNCDQMSPPN